MIDEIGSSNIKEPINIIVNIESSKENGAHWSAFHKSKNGKKYFFDSYGLPPQKEIINKFKTPIIVNDFIIQILNTKLCGQYCLYVLYKLNNLKDVSDIDFLEILLELKKE